MNRNAGGIFLLIAFLSITMLFFRVTPPTTKETALQAAPTVTTPPDAKPTVSLSPVETNAVAVPVIVNRNRVRFPTQLSSTHATALTCLKHLESLKRTPKDRHGFKRRMLAVVFMLSEAACAKNYPTSIRHIYIDLGARDYESSVGFFRKKYPRGNRFEVHAFEVHPAYQPGYEADKKCTFYLAAAWTATGCLAMGTQNGFAGASHSLTFVPVTTNKPNLTECLQKIPKVENMIGPVPAIDIAEFLGEVLQGLTPENSFVVLKVDIEGPEFQIVEHLKKSGAFAGMIKETLVECHWDHHGGSFKGIPLAKCHKLHQDLRDMGVYAHEWY